MNEKRAIDWRDLPELDEDLTTRLAETFRLMEDRSRLRIIAACLAGPAAVGAIAREPGLSPSPVSHHRRLLRAARVLRRRRGQQVFYEAADRHITCVIADMLDHLQEPECTEGSGDADLQPL